MPHRNRLGFSLGLSLFAAACSSPQSAATSSTTTSASSTSSGVGGAGGAGGNTTSSGGGGSGGAAFTPGPHEPFPVVKSLGGPVIANMDIITITFAGDIHDKTINDYADWIVGSSWLDTVGKDYGVGLGKHSAHIVLPDTAPLTASNAETETRMQQLVMSGTLPAPGADTLYLLLYPSSTVITDFSDRPNCVVDANGDGTIGGYHWETSVGGVKFPFIVLPTCSTGNLAEIYLEASASHEVIEAATDPLPLTDPTYVVTDLTSSWSAVLLGEVGDLCEGLTWLNDNGHWAQPSWSKSSAALGDSPCLPAAIAPYYNASLTPSTVQYVKAGDSVQLEARGWSTAPMGDWDLSTTVFGDFTPTIDVGAKKLNNNQSTTVKVTVPKGTKPGAKASILFVSTRDAKTRDFNYWPASIVVK